MKKLVAFVCLWFLLAPAPWGIALNYETQECAGFWAGDEYGYYRLPEGWKAYYPDNHNVIETDIGSCQWERDDWDGRAESCCKQLGYSYTGDNIGAGHGGPTFFTIGIIAALVCSALAVVGVVVGFFVGGGFFVRWLIKKSR